MEETRYVSGILDRWEHLLRSSSYEGSLPSPPSMLWSMR